MYTKATTVFESCDSIRQPDEFATLTDSLSINEYPSSAVNFSSTIYLIPSRNLSVGAITVPPVSSGIFGPLYQFSTDTLYPSPAVVTSYDGVLYSIGAAVEASSFAILLF